ncbi:MAG: dihydroxyacetone kinase subunit L [Selenomonadaceae bacterium]|nr:dihydroxyacetone kinase subunit L [Selenomonadaceae bacterium]
MVRDAIDAVIKAILKEKDFLNEVDEKIGDGDHGLNMARGAQAIKDTMKTLDENASLQEILSALGEAVTINVGGSAGHLYGAALSEIAKVVDEKSAPEPVTLAKVFGAAVDAIQKRGKAELGDKTMLDVLIPIRDSFQVAIGSDRSFEEILTEARDAARGGVEFTKTIPAKKGRAAAFGNKSIGFEDAGATSSMIIFRALCNVWKDNLRQR